MKYINIKDLTEDQVVSLDNIIESRLAIYDQEEQQIDYDVNDLMVDENGVVYAPTEAMSYQEVSNSGDDIPGGRSEIRTELKGYEPIYTILKNQ